MTDPTTLADWATHCRDKAAAWDKVSPLIRDHAADWRALLEFVELAEAYGPPHTDDRSIAAVARIAAKLEQPT